MPLTRENTDKQQLLADVETLKKLGYTVKNELLDKLIVIEVKEEDQENGITFIETIDRYFTCFTFLPIKHLEPFMQRFPLDKVPFMARIIELHELEPSDKINNNPNLSNYSSSHKKLGF